MEYGRDAEARHMRLLIVDDDIATAEVIRKAVNWETLGVDQVYTAYNMEQAKARLLEEKISLVISDIEMPQGSGIELLTWFREQKLEGEFLFLTSHERFDYATNAVKLHAAEYLLKPLDVAVMEAAIKKLILSIEEERRRQEDIAYGAWAKRNRRQMQLAFWERVLDGRISERFEEELCQRGLSLDAGEAYRLVVSRVTDLERDKERINQGLMRFIMENMHSEILCGTPENASVICYEHEDDYIVAAICGEKAKEDWLERCRELIQKFKRMFSATITCCVSEKCGVGQLGAALRRTRRLLTSSAAYYGDCFREEEGQKEQSQSPSLLDFKQMEGFLERGDMLRFMGCLKERLNEKVRDKTLNGQILLRMKQDILQMVYASFARQGIEGEGFFLDESVGSLTGKAARSAMDMVRWASFLLKRADEYREEALRGQTIIDKINGYIRQHYAENIGRNEIAGEFFLAPEYVSKMYKKQTGCSLGDAINRYRIEQAKLLLRDESLRVSDVAGRVGFDNFAYFSTMFKKYTGMTPNQYRKP